MKIIEHSYNGTGSEEKDLLGIITDVDREIYKTHFEVEQQISLNNSKLIAGLIEILYKKNILTDVNGLLWDAEIRSKDGFFIVKSD